MNVTILNGLEDKDKIVQVLEGNGERCFLLDSKEPLFQFIDDLDLEGRLLARFTIANQIIFSCEVHFQTPSGKRPVSSLADVIRLYEPDAEGEWALVVNTEDYDLVSYLIQQIVYLELDIRVMMDREELDLHRIQSFLNNAEELKQAVDSAKTYMQENGLYNQQAGHGEGYSYLLKTLSGQFEKAGKQTLHVAVMGTKKAGKSVVVNSLLGQVFAPTSLELPTPAACIYKGHDDKLITLAHGEEELVFSNTEAAHAYLTKQF